MNAEMETLQRVTTKAMEFDEVWMSDDKTIDWEIVSNFLHTP